MGDLSDFLFAQAAQPVQNPMDAWLAGQQQAQQRAAATQALQFQQGQNQATVAQQQRIVAAQNAYTQNPTPINRTNLVVSDPAHAVAFKSAFDDLDTAAQNSELTYHSALQGYLDAGQSDAAIAKIQARKAAEQAAGMDTTGEDDMIAMLNGGPDGLAAAKKLNTFVLSSARPDKFDGTIKTLGDEDRANAELPGKVALTAAQTDQANAEAAKARYISAPLGTNILKIDGATPPAGAPPSQVPAAPGQTQAPPAAVPPTGSVPARIAAAAQSAGASPADAAYLQTTAQLESKGNPAAQNGTSTGLFQFHPDTFAGVGGKDINSVEDQTQAALALAQKNFGALKPALGRDPTPAEVYLAHQQGSGGATALLTADPNSSAVAALTPIYAAPGRTPGQAQALAIKAIVNNGGTPGMTAGQFVQKWQDNYASASRQQAASSPGTSQPGPVSTELGSVTPGSGLSLAYGDPSNADARMDDASVAMVGQQYLELGPVALQNLGQGKAGVDNKNRIMKWAANAAAEAGTSNPQLVARFVQNKANVAALTQQTKSLSSITTSEQTLDKNLDYIQSLAGKGVGPTGIPILDTPINKLRANAGSVDAKNYDNLVKTSAAEYARILTTSTGTGGGVTSDMAMSEANGLINNGMSLRQIQGAIQVAKQEAENRRLSYSGEVNRLTGQISGQPPQPAPTATPTSQRLSPQDAAKLPPGTPFVSLDGRQLVRH